MKKAIGAVTLLLTAGMYAYGAAGNVATASIKQEKSLQKEEQSAEVVAEQDVEIPSQTGIWIDLGANFIWVRGYKKTYTIDCLLPNLLGGISIRYQRSGFIMYTTIFSYGYMHNREYANNNKGIKAWQKTNQLCKASHIALGYQHKRHGFLVYFKLQPTSATSAIGLEYSYLLGNSILIQTRCGYTIMPRSNLKLHGVDASINFAYKIL